MKHLKYINESNKSDTIDYIKFCFLDILDDDRFRVKFFIGWAESDTDVIRLAISPKRPRPDGNAYIGTWETNIQDLKENNDIISELYSDIETSINRVLDKFSIVYDIKTNKIGTIYISFKLTKNI